MNYDLNVFRFADKDGPWKIQEIPAAVSDIAKKGKTGDEKIYFDFTMFAFLLFFSVSLFSYLQIHVAYHTVDFYFLFGKRERKKRNMGEQSENFIWRGRIKNWQFDKHW